MFTERTLDTNVNHHRLDAELGYFINEQWSMRFFGAGKKGNGYLGRELVPKTAGQTNAYWYHHDQISVHDYAEIGVGADYRFGNGYTLSGALHHLVWGQTVYNFRYSAEVRITKEF